MPHPWTLKPAGSPFLSNQLYGYSAAAQTLLKQQGDGPTITIGCDPELFLRKNGKMVSAHDILPGTKSEPHKVEGGAIQVDGVAAEFNIEPTTSAAQFSALVTQVMGSLKEYAKDCELQIIPAYEWEPVYFGKLPAHTKTLGCDPDYNGWTGQQNPAPAGGVTTLRTAAGHMHGGFTKVDDLYSETHFIECCAIAKQLDYYVGVPSMLWDTDSRRRTLYGKAGAMRPKLYGLEYRTPSNVWLRYPSLYPWMWNAMYYGIHSMLTGKPRLYDEFGDVAQQAIDTNDVDFARSPEFKKIFKHTGLSWPQW